MTIAPNKRYLQFSDGASFYGVGMWYNDDYNGPAEDPSASEASTS